MKAWRMRESVLLTLLLLCLSASFAALSVNLRPPGGTLPFAVGLLTSLLLIVQLILDARRPPAATLPATGESRALLVAPALAAALYVAGFVLVLPLFTGYYLRTRTAATWRTAALAALFTGAFTAGGFGWFLEAPIHRGVLWDWLDPGP